jgi:hypothetical protein
VRLGLTRPPQHFEEIAVVDLLRMALRRFGGLTVVVDELDPTLPPLRAEVSALSSAIAHLLRTVAERRAPELAPVRLRAGLHRHVLQLDIGAGGSTLPASLEPTLDALTAIIGFGDVSVRELIHQHAGEAWACGEQA